MDAIRPELFLSKLCEKTFANYAFTQIKKAYGLEKKIVNPVGAERKSVLDFCFVYQGKDAISANIFLEHNDMLESNVGLTVIPHLRDCYNLYHSKHIYIRGLYEKKHPMMWL